MQTKHLPPFCPMWVGLALEEEEKVKVKVPVGCAVTRDNVGCWPMGTGSSWESTWDDLDGLSLAGEFSHPSSVNVDWSYSSSAVHTPPTFSKCAWMNCDPSLVAVLRPSNSSSSKKSSVIYEGQNQWESVIILYTYLACYGNDQRETVHAIAIP